ncbi:hypothetical protein SAMN05216251_102542 [Actinacidiphila alni]|uniref:Band 7 domain-containing protein n=1 Tax=Actinacidiphila alni TaxID=380248 RepID=A0A1I1ZRE4_9ACTN|nr:hypothetical protein [Actinacidiphila alni]SFE33978.1 hypothetical protein SAMN05216251_102542 [Actinacidiphila alni]
MAYPVVSEHVLDPVTGQLFKRRRRENMPPLLPGTVYVLQVGGHYRQYPEGLVFDPGHDDVLDASSVSLVDTRVRVVEVRRTLHSVSEADEFTIGVSFSCQVTDPELVARQGVVDVTAPLRAYLAGEDELPRTAAEFRIEEINAVRESVARRMTAYTTVAPPRVAGMQVEFVGTEVYVAEDLRGWEQTLRQQRRDQELQQGKQDFETRQTQQMAELLSLGPLYAEVLHMVRDGADMADVVRRMNEATALEQSRRATTEDAAATHARDMEKSVVDLIRVLLARPDGDAVFSEELIDVLIRLRNPAGESGPALTAGSPKSGARPQSTVGEGRRKPYAAGDGFVREEDDLVE